MEKAQNDEGITLVGNTVLFSSKTGDITFPITPTSADGMTIGATTPAPATVSTLNVGPIPVANGNTIAANTTSSPTPITAETTSVTTADSTHIAVILPTGVVGDSRLVYNTAGGTSETISIYCQSTDKIDGGSAGGNVTLTAAHRAAWFYCVAANSWISALVGAVST
jgi:hypothetical protein